MTTTRVINSLKRSPESLNLHAQKESDIPELNLYDYEGSSDEDEKQKDPKKSFAKATSFFAPLNFIQGTRADREVAAIMQGKGNAEFVKHDKRL